MVHRMIEPDIPVHKLIQSISKQLCKKYCNKPLCTQYAWWVLEAITKQKKTALLQQESIHLTEQDQATLDAWIKKQVEDNIPLQYLIGSVPFTSCDILVEPPILIPRHETEMWCVDLISKLQKVPNQTFRILDLCTGSGCLAIALAKAFPQAKVYGSDISEHALELAQKNALRNNVSIIFIASDLFANIPKELSFDIIIANPPYISKQEWNQLDPSVKEWEDAIALIANDSGIGIIKQIIDQSALFLDGNSELRQYDIPQVIMEIGHTQGDTVKTLYHKAGFTNVKIQKDLQDNNRIVSGCIQNVESNKKT